MFKKTKIAAVSAAILGLSSMAVQADQGVSINTAGSHGEVLIFPYYNVNNDFITAFNITNTTSDYKAIKIRFRESENSNDVLDFNIYLSPFDVFTMDLNKGSDDGVNLTTTDKSCTDPAIPAGGVLFRHSAYATTDVSDVREGYLEVIEMGVVNEDAYVLIDTNIPDGPGNRQTIAAGGILHVNGLPKDCSVINRAWLQSVFVAGGARSNTRSIDIVNSRAVGFPNYASDTGWYGQDQPWSNPVVITDYLSTAYNLRALYPPQGGLVGSSILVDRVSIAGFVAEPISVTNYSTRAQHYLSSDENFYLLPSLASGSVHIAQDSNNEYSVVARDWGMDDTNQLPRISVPSGINPMPISDAILVTSLANQYFLGAGTRTDWVISAPMRKHAIYNNYQYVPTSANFDKDVDIPIAASATAANGYWKNIASSANDVNASFIYWDREENQTTPQPGDFSPPELTPETKVIFKREVNVLALGTGSGIGSVLGSDNSVDLTLDAGFVNGWGRFSFNGNPNYDLAGARYAEWVHTDNHSDALGVPLFGFMAATSELGSANVGESFPHFYQTN